MPAKAGDGEQQDTHLQRKEGLRMSDQERRFWPFRPYTTLAWSMAMLAGLLSILLVLKRYGLWPIGAESDTAVLTGVVLVSLLPVGLAVLDIIIARGGVIQYGGVMIDFSQGLQMGVPGFPVPTNIGIPGQPVNDRSTTEILDALRKATTCETVLIDLEDGQAWWETRLLVLLAGAVRRGRPAKVVFVGRDAGFDGCFQGWGYSVKLLPYLLRAHPQYLRSYHAAQAAGRQWNLAEPEYPGNSGSPAAALPQPFSIQAGLAAKAKDLPMAFDSVTGLPDALLTEQLLALDLGERVEKTEGPRTISLVRLKEVFQPVLYKSKIDTSWPVERQMTEFFDSKFDHLAVTQKGEYVSLTSRLSVLNAFVKSVVAKEQG